MKRKQAADILIAYTYLYISICLPSCEFKFVLFYFRFLKKEESLTSLGKNYINPKKNQSLLKEIYLTTYDVPFQLVSGVSLIVRVGSYRNSE